MTHRHARRRHSRYRRVLTHAPQVGIVASWCVGESEIPHLQRETHDRLIALMGDERTGPVQWRWTDGALGLEVVETLLDHSIKTGDVESENQYRLMHGLLEEQGGWIVTAMAPGR